MKIAVFGNSHITALKLGWPPTSLAAPTFFGAPGQSVRGSLVDQDGIVPANADVADYFRMTSGGLDRLLFKNYDAVWLVGLSTGIFRFMGPLRKHRLFNNNASTLPLMSRAAFEACTFGTEKALTFDTLAKQIRAVSNIPITVVPDPMPSENILSCPKEGYVWKPPYAPEALERFQNWTRKLASNGLTVVHQPLATLREGWLTKSEFSEGSKKLLGDLTHAHDEDEYFHMNARYGALVVAEAMRMS